MPNRLTAQFRDAVRTVYESIGGNEAFATWARENRGDFYKIAARLIPAEYGRAPADGGNVIQFVVDRTFQLRRAQRESIAAELLPSPEAAEK